MTASAVNRTGVMDYITPRATSTIAQRYAVGQAVDALFAAQTGTGSTTFNSVTYTLAFTTPGGSTPNAEKDLTTVTYNVSP